MIAPRVDLGIGTGLLARQFARQGAVVTGSMSPRTRFGPPESSLRQTLAVRFEVAPAQETRFPDASYDAIAANQCWVYFDTTRAIREVKRLLRPGRVLVTSGCTWLPRLDPLDRASEQLVLKFNPQWGGIDWPGHIPDMPSWAVADFNLIARFWYDEPIPFTRESWRGRIRAYRGVGATLSDHEVCRFDREHAQLLARITGETFSILHRINAHLLRSR